MGSLDVPDYGHRLLVHVVDDVASQDPTRDLAVFPRPGCSDNLTSPDSWQHVSFLQAARAINRLAHAVAATVDGATPQVGLSGLVGPTLAYIGPNDVRYILFVLAVSKAGGQALLISPRNTTEGQTNLFAKTGCHALWVPATYRPAVESWPAQTPGGLELVDMPELDVLLSDEDPSGSFVSDFFPFSKTFDEAAADALVILHTSGTTGLPKPIVLRHGMWAVLDTYQGATDKSQPTMIWSGWKKHITYILNTTPLFHTAGAATAFGLGVYNGIASVFPPSDRPVSSIIVEDILTHSVADGAIMAPFVIEELAKTATGEAALVRMNCVIPTGGSLSKATGDRLVEKGVIISNMISSTEALPYSLQFQDDMSAWDYFVFRDDAMGCDWRPVPGSDNLFELVIVRKKPRQKTPGMQVAFWSFPELDEWSTRDLFQRHPTRHNHWKYYSRLDNIIVFSNGEKLNPEDIELGVSRHPSVRGALVVGAGRFQAALLIEPHDAALADQVDPAAAAKKLVDDVWPFVDAANKITVAHGRIARPLVVLTDSAKPFPRAGKGTIQRPMAIKLYEREIDDLYRRTSSSDGTTWKNSDSSPIVLDTSSEAALAKSIRTVFVDRLGASPRLDVDTDFFSVGAVDSLQVMNAIRVLKESLAIQNQTKGVSLSQRTVYGNPTPARLARYILFAATNSADGTTAEGEEIGQMEVLISRYTADLKTLPVRSRSAPRVNGQTVLVTGTTGSLGAYILDSLLHRNAGVQKIIAVNRDPDGGKVRQERVLRSKGLNTSELSDPSRVQFLHANLSQPRLGLSSTDYDTLLADVDRIVHCAWPVDFNYSVASFEPSIAGVRHLADLAAAASRRVPLLFVSSISVVDGWGKASRGDVPEAQLDDLHLAGMGYGRSKLVSSLVLDAVSDALDVPVVQVRLGQVAGPRSVQDNQGTWNRQELIPSVIASSVYLGALPDSLGVLNAVDWVPSEDAAQVIIELVGASGTVGKNGSKETGLQSSYYFNLVNPSPQSWASLAPHVKKFYGDRIKEIISFKAWVARLEESSRSAGTAEAAAANPAVKLIDRLQAMDHASDAGWTQPTFALERSKEASTTLRNMGPVTGELMEQWCRQWAF